MNEQRGANIKLFGPDRVRQFCVSNDIEVIVTPPSQSRSTPFGPKPRGP